MSWNETLRTLFAGQPLSRAQASAAMQQVIAGELAPEQIGAFLGALRARRETVDEIAGFVDALLANAVALPADGAAWLDNCGTGGDDSGTFNISTASALVLAAAGVPVAKHGNRSISSRSGSVDVLEALGISLELSPADTVRCLSETGFGFFFAQKFHPALKRVATIRRTLGVRTVFNLLGPLLHPARIRRQLMGVYEPTWAAPLATVLGQLGREHAVVVCGELEPSDGPRYIDEVSLCGPTHLAWLRDQQVHEESVTPEELGLERVASDELRGGSAAENAELMLKIFDPAFQTASRWAPREVVVLNAGLGLWLAGRATGWTDGIAAARAQLASGAAGRLVERLRGFK